MPNHSRSFLLQRIFAALLLISTAVLVSCSPGSRIAQQQVIESSAEISSERFRHITASQLDSPWREGNHIETLVNGDEFYPAMIDAIRAAEKTITFETYAFVEGYAALDLVNALSERAYAGVKVHMVLDQIGSNTMGEQNIQALRSAGVELYFYHPFSILKPHEYNIRDHRKIMVIDGKTGFTGGCGVGDAWLGDAQTEGQWRETHYQVTGPIVADLQQGFMMNWRKVGGSELRGNDYFPQLTQTGRYTAQAIDSAPQDKSFPIPFMYRQAIASARKSIIIENSYVIFDKILMDAIIDARSRGVHVEILTASDHSDSWAVRRLSLYQYPRLLKAGVHLYEFQPSMMHCKVMVIDDIFTSIGSANFDPRSLYINDESNMNVISKTFAEEQLRVINDDKQRSKRILTTKHPWDPFQLPIKMMLKVTESQM